MRAGPFEPFVGHQEVVVLDGGLATALEAAGHRLDTRLWSAAMLRDAPDAIRDVHRAYLEAGAECVITASYQASHDGFRALGLTDEACDEALRLSVRLAREACDDFWAQTSGVPGRRPPLVAASIGPFGAYLADGSEYDGRYGVGPDALHRFHRRRFRVLGASDADVLACETIPSALEARVLLELLDDVGGAWAWMSFSCRDGRRLWDGTELTDVVRACAERERVAAVGVNCTAPRHVSELLARAADVTELPLIAYPNSGERYDAVTKTWYGAGPDDDWLEAVDEWIAAGARIVGGCCRVGPETISRLRVRVATGGSEAHDHG